MSRRAWAVAVAGLAALLTALAWPLPEAWFAQLADRRVTDTNGLVLAERAVPSRGRAEWVELDRVSPHVIDALIAAEDQRFWQHPGVDPLAVARAAWADARAGAVVQGGSTLSMQTARLLAGRPPGLAGKAVEAWRALRLDLHLSKEELLTWYLNRASFSPGTVGIEAAARHSFDEAAASLSLSEAALLVGALPAPSRLHPSVDLAAARTERERVLRRMLALGLVEAEAAERARSEPIQLRRPASPGEAPHLAAHLLASRDGEVHSTVDLGLQRDVEAIVARQLARLAGREVDHAAVLVVERTAAGPTVRAWVGSGDFTAEDGENDGVRTPRSPGSTLKPFLYALALERGWRPSDVLADLPVSYATSHGSWAPRNYGEDFAGPLPLREALATSANVPAVRLLDAVGVATLQERLVALGLPLTEPASTYGLGLVLGGGEVSLEQLVTAYAALADGGRYQPLRLTEGEPPSRGEAVLDPVAAWQIADILADPLARAPAFGRHGALARAYPAAAKTGTSTGFRDNWTVGFTDRWVVGVWVGNFDGRPMGDVSGITGAGPIWAEVMDRATGGEAAPLEPPVPLIQQTTCALSGGAPGPHCPHTTELAVPEGTAPPEPCAWHAACGVRWPAEYLPWAAERGRLGACADGALAGAGIAYPTEGAVLYVDPRYADSQRVPLEARAPAGSAATWWVDGEAVATGPAEEVALWAPREPGAHTVRLHLDGREVGAVTVHVGGVR